VTGKISGLTAASSVAATDILEVTVDPAGTPASRKVTVAALVAAGGALNNFTATSAPTVNDDSGDGYAVGSFWFWAATQRLFMCAAATVGAAIWTPIPHSGLLHDGYVSGRWYTTDTPGLQRVGVTGFSSTTTIVDPFFVYRPVTISELAVVITAGASAGRLGRAAIYANSAGRPTGTPLAESGEWDFATTGAYTSDITDVTLQPGMYWRALQVSNNSVSILGPNNATTTLSYHAGAALASNVLSLFGALGFSVSSTYGTWPDLTSASFTALNVCASLAIRVA
jgi:hypothetical protein